jgi:hypothetical protein
MPTHWKRLLPALLWGLAGTVSVQSCFASLITFDFSNVHWVNGTASESFEVYLANPGSNITIGLQPATGPSVIAPTVAAAYGAVESSLQINVADSDRWGLLGIRADLHFYGDTAQLTVRTVGASAPAGTDYQARLDSYQTALVADRATLGTQRFWDGNAGNSVYLFNTMLPSMVGLNTQTNTFDLTAVRTAALFASIVNLTPDAPPAPFPGFGGGGLEFGESDNPEPASLVMLGSGVLILGFMRRRSRIKKTLRETA